MTRPPTSLALAAAAMLSTSAWCPAAQPAKSRIDLASIPDNIKKLDWRSIDTAALPAVERARATMLLDDTLREMGAQMTAEADLLSEYIEQQDLGAEFAAHPEVDDSPAVTFPEAIKVAAAMIRGPMANSTYATAHADTPDANLPAYEKLYQSSAERRWAAATESRLNMRSMSRFLRDTKRMDAYKAWLPAELDRRAKEADAEAARQRAELEQKQKEKAEQREHRRQQIQEQKQAEQEQQAQERQAAMQMQQAMCAAQAPADSGAVVGYDDYPNWYYGGVGYLGASQWYRDAGYQGRAADRVSDRMRGWRGGGGGGGGRRGGGRR